MSKSFSYPNKGTCSKETHIVLNDDQEPCGRPWAFGAVSAGAVPADKAIDKLDEACAAARIRAERGGHQDGTTRGGDRPRGGAAVEQALADQIAAGAAHPASTGRRTARPMAGDAAPNGKQQPGRPPTDDPLFFRKTLETPCDLRYHMR